MNISYNWLKEYVNFDLTPEENSSRTYLYRFRDRRRRGSSIN